jgi:hypothetical protein
VTNSLQYTPGDYLDTPAVQALIDDVRWGVTIIAPNLAIPFVPSSS